MNSEMFRLTDRFLAMDSVFYTATAKNWNGNARRGGLSQIHALQSRCAGSASQGVACCVSELRPASSRPGELQRGVRAVVSDIELSHEEIGPTRCVYDGLEAGHFHDD